MSEQKTEDDFGKWWAGHRKPGQTMDCERAVGLSAWQACEEHFQEQIRALGLENAGQAGCLAAARYELELLESHLQYIEEANTRLAEAEQMLQGAKEKIKKARVMRTMYDIDRGR